MYAPWRYELRVAHAMEMLGLPALQINRMGEL